MDIDQWLHALGLEQYAPAFAGNDIDLAMLAQLDDADLKELGVLSLGHRKRLLAAIAESPRRCTVRRRRPLWMRPQASAGKSPFFSPICVVLPRCRRRSILKSCAS